MASSLCLRPHTSISSSFSPLQSNRRSATSQVRCVSASEAPLLSSESAPLVPRRCTLKELTFTEDGRLVNQPLEAFGPSPASKSSELLDLLVATVEASAQVKDLETLTGRLSMIAFFIAIAVEYSTGAGAFSALDSEGLQRSLGLALLVSVGSGAFAVAMRGKKNVTDILSSKCKRWMDSTVDSLVDALFFEESMMPFNPEGRSQGGKGTK